MTENEERHEAREEASEAFALSLEGDGIKIQRSVDRHTALEVVALLMGGSPSVIRGQEPGSADRLRGRRDARSTGRSLREYLNEVGAARNPDQIVTIASYLIDERGQGLVTSAEIKREFPSAGEPIPANFSRDFRLAVTSGWLGEDPGQAGAFYITETGRNAIARRFSGEVRRATGQPRRRRGRRTTPRNTTQE